MKPNSTWYANLQRIRILMMSVISGHVLSQTELTVRDIARLIGKLTASIQAIYPAPLHYRQLQRLKNTALQSGGNTTRKSASILHVKGNCSGG